MKDINEIASWIKLWRVSGVGSKYFQRLLNKYQSPDVVFNLQVSALTEAGISQKLANSILSNKDSNSAIPDIDWLNDADNHHIITIECADYPELLKRIDNPPPILYVHGNLSIINDPQLAIVGSRNPTQGGNSNATEFAKYLGKSGLCITSGLALGIDAMAHNGALEVNAPTIAVIATGIDRVYPAKNRDLAHKIVENGAIVSEFPIGMHPDSRNFPRRNRIISGLSFGTLVVEAAHRSGSLITARLAMEQNREVFAIPGSIHNPLARGCHQLIRQGAKLVETGQDIMEELAAVIEMDSISMGETGNVTPDSIDLHSADQINDKNLNPEHTKLLEHMGFDPVAIDQLVIRTGHSSEELSAMLLILELQNHISSNGAGIYTRLK